MSSEKMIALMVTEIGKKTELREIPKPEVDDESIIIKTFYSGISIGTEMLLATGKIKGYGDVPFINGYQASGVVYEMGSKMEGISKGDYVTVFCSGSHCQYVKASADLVHKLSGKASLKEASLFVQPSTSANALNMAGVKTGDIVYVVGQGLIGQCTAILARLRGAYVIASDISQSRLNISRKYCADWVIDASKMDKVSNEIKKRYPKGLDVVIESTGLKNLLDDAFECCKEKGFFVFEGLYPGTISYNFIVPHTKQIHSYYPCFIGERSVRESVIRLIESKTLNMDVLISNTVGWEKSPNIYNDLFTSKRNSYNGIVIDWTKV